MKIDPNNLRWTCPPEWLAFNTTAELDCTDRIEGQPDAEKALNYGLSVACDHQHIYVRGMTGVDRLGLLKQLAEEVDAHCEPAHDKCFVHNFEEPRHPILLSLPPGKAKLLKSAMERFIRFVRDELETYLGSDMIRAQRTRINQETQLELKKVGEPFEEELKSQGLALIPVESEGNMVPSILPIINGKATTITEFNELRASGSLSEEEVNQILDRLQKATEKYQEVATEVQGIHMTHAERTRDLLGTEARRAAHVQLKDAYAIEDDPILAAYLLAVENDLVDHRLGDLNDPVFLRLYEINIISSHEPADQAPVIIEHHPTQQSLFGSVDRRWSPDGVSFSDHMMIEAGSLVAADGGYLLLEARDVLEEPGLWQQLKQTLRSRSVDLGNQEGHPFIAGNALIPKPIPIKVKVILVGDHETYYLLDTYDPHFTDLFKVLADFDDSCERTENNVKMFANVIANIARRERLLPVSSQGVAALAEHGARIAGEKSRITMRFGRVSDILREADWIAKRRQSKTIDPVDILDAIDSGRRRADLQVRRFRRMIQSGDIRIDVTGSEVGQINGLAVSRTGPLTYGFPARITASVGAGTEGTINIEREANLSGSIHTKGFGIVDGLMRQLIQVAHPVAFTASLVFEQSYGGIDGDSASCAEICVLLSALANIALRQDLAITGAIDQKGNILPIGGVTEKVEGFFAACRDLGFNGSQGVIIPRSNVGDLNLRREVIDEAKQGRFSVFAVSTVFEALSLLADMEVVQRDATGYRAETFLARAEKRVTEYWQLISNAKKSLA